MLKIILPLFSLSLLFCSFGQEDVRSQKIIDDMVAKFKSYPSVCINFSATVSQMQDDSEMDFEGKIWLKTNKYKLETQEQVLYFDGVKLYQHLIPEKEVNVSKPEPNESNEDFQLLNPQTYFNLSSKSFKSVFIKETTIFKRKVSEIDLYPIQVKTTKYHRIRIMVETNSLQLVYLKAFLKDGTHYEITFKPYEILSTALRDSFFMFSVIENPDVEVIDLTF